MGPRTLRNSGPLALLMFALVAVAIVATRSEAQNPFDAMGVDRLAEPRSAPDLTFISVDGREMRLRDLRGRVVLLSFFTTS